MQSTSLIDLIHKHKHTKLLRWFHNMTSCTCFFLSSWFLSLSYFYYRLHRLSNLSVRIKLCIQRSCISKSVLFLVFLCSFSVSFVRTCVHTKRLTFTFIDYFLCFCSSVSVAEMIQQQSQKEHWMLLLVSVLKFNCCLSTCLNLLLLDNYKQFMFFQQIFPLSFSSFENFLTKQKNKKRLIFSCAHFALLTKQLAYSQLTKNVNKIKYKRLPMHFPLTRVVFFCAVFCIVDCI